jgi:SpoVK/Ycf46/Vps4 family AAA+-type ATPase
VDTLVSANFGRLRKEFKKRLNDLDPKDRVILIACTSKQHEAGAKEMKDMKEFFDKSLFFPFPNYSTRKLVFKTMVERAGGTLKENFPLSTLSYITEGYTAGSFKRAIDKVLTERRRAQVSHS